MAKRIQSDRPSRVIMVVDDDRLALKQIAAAIKRGGHWAITVEDGEAALYRVPGLELDLIILDSVMPGMDGPQVLRHLKKNENTASIPVMMLTSRTHRASVEKALELGADDYVAKPVDPVKLLDRIEKLLEKLETRAAVDGRVAVKASSRAQKGPVLRPANRVRLDLSDAGESAEE